MRVAALALVALAMTHTALAVTPGCPSLSPAEVTTVASNVTSLAAGDVDLDGRWDVAVGTESGQVVVHQRNADHTFTPFTFLVEGRPVAVAMGDFDSNNTADLAVVHNSSQVSIIRLASDFTRIDGMTLAAEDNPVAIAAVNINGDINLDLVVANMFSNDVSVFLGNGFGWFTPFGLYPAGNAPAGIAAADFDGDGKQDVVVANFMTSQVSLLRGDGTGKLDAFPLQTIAAGTDPSSVAAGDFNNDGIPDIAVANFGSASLSVIIGARSGGAYTPLPAVVYPVGRAPVAITAAHFDSGPNLDLIVSNAGTSTVSLLSGVGDSTFTAAGMRDVDGLPWATTPGIFDDSQVKGIAAAQFASPAFSIFTSGCPEAPALADFYPTAGPLAGGQTVRLTGHSFGDTLGVTFGGTPAQIVSISGSTVTVKTPPRATNDLVTVAITTSSGTDSLDNYAYTAAPGVTISSPSGSRGGSQQVILDGGTTEPLRPSFENLLKEVRFGTVPAKILGSQSLGSQMIVEVPPSVNGAVGSVPVTAVTWAGNVILAYQYTNTAPVPVAGGTRTVLEDIPERLLVDGSDADLGDQLTVAIATQPTKGKVSRGWKTNPLLDQWTIIYTPNRNATGSDSFALTMSDGTSTSAPVTIPVSIMAQNDAPVGTPQLITINEDTSTPVVLGGTDVENSPLTSFVKTPPTLGTLSGSAPNLTYTPHANAHGSDSFEFIVSDGETNSQSAVVSIEITNVNDPPIVADQSVTMDEDTREGLTLNVSDADQEGLGFKMTTQPAHGVLTGYFPTPIYTPNENYSGPDSFAYRASDGQVTSPVATVSITVNSVNDAPVGIGQPITTNEDKAVNITLVATDVDGPPPSVFSIAQQPAKGTLSGTPPALTYTPKPNLNGSDTFTFTASDGALSSAPALMVVTIKPVNDAPTATGQTVTTSEDTSRPITLLGADVDNEPLTYVIVTPPAKGSLSGTGANQLYTPNPNANGADAFTFLTNDGKVASPAASVAVNITPVNDAPVALSQTLVADISTPLRILLIGYDAELSPLAFTVKTSPLHGTLSGTPPNLIYSPAIGYRGNDTFTFSVNDGALSSIPGTVSIVISAPRIMATGISVNENAGTAKILLRLSNKLTLPVGVNFATANGTATAPEDYQKTAGTLTFSPGETEKTLSIPVVNDSFYEASESFRLDLTGPTNATVDNPSLTVKIADDDPPPLVTISDARMVEGNSGTSRIDFTLTLIGETLQPVTVKCATKDGTAKAGSDYNARTENITFSPGQKVRTFSVLVRGDTEVEADETFSVVLTPVSNGLAGPPGTGTILTDEPQRRRSTRH